ncbi:hypothetical protein IC582_029815 [Cucumis melo]|uniref:Uncharacterized protein LOC103482740 n=1 Tax=Cucumis melo TaxID=3656 RepID=A0A1S3AU67_CUCME|nr:uncharacterized protein LOC103482740 [Cucumis melo]
MGSLLILTFVFGFVFGVVAIVAVEAFGIFIILNKFSKRSQKDLAKANAKLEQSELDPLQSLEFLSNKQGSVWILESNVLEDIIEKGPKEQKKRRDFLEVTPVKKYARIKDHTLMITELDGNKRTTIQLNGCTVESVSATDLPSRKWVKRFPLILENRTSVIYNESKRIFIFLETSWEKESWCKALRLASCVDKEKLQSVSKLQKEFHSYISSLSTGYPSFMKPSSGHHTEAIDKEIKPNVHPSKVRQFFKKLAKKTSKAASDYIANPSSLREEKKFSERFHPSPDFISSAGLVKGIPKAQSTKSFFEEDMGAPSTLTHSISQSHASVISDADTDDRFWTDEGTLCWNLLMSRFFFDATSNEGLMKSLHDRIQRMLSKMRTPSYIGEIICTKVDPGNLPPNINIMRVLPFELNEVWALEVDFEYSGGFALDIETRIEVHELDLQKNAENSKSDSSDVGEVSSFLEDYLGKQLSTSEGTDQSDEGGPGNIKNPASSSSSSSGSRWKSLMNSIAKQVSQVPISLVIKIGSLRGTLRLHIKPPPSDQLWYSFTSMPYLELRLASSFGDHKITSAHVAQFLNNRIKAVIRDTLVLPNSESIYIPFMMAEKDDWVPRDIAPFMWLNQGASDNKASCENQSSHPVEAKNRSEAAKTTSTDQQGIEHKRPKNVESSQPHSDLSNASKPSSSTTNPARATKKTLDENEMKIPLLENDQAVENFQQRSREYAQENHSPSRSISSLSSGQENYNAEEDEKPKRIGRRARMLEIGKKMGEKLEEKRRNIEEKSRNIVEKMRGP